MAKFDAEKGFADTNTAIKTMNVSEWLAVRNAEWRENNPVKKNFFNKNKLKKNPFDGRKAGFFAKSKYSAYVRGKRAERVKQIKQDALKVKAANVETAEKSNVILGAQGESEFNTAKKKKKSTVSSGMGLGTSGSGSTGIQL